MATRYNANGTIEYHVRPRHGRAFELDELQAIVGGYIEAFRITADTYLILNEDGKRLALPQNLRATALAQKSHLAPWDVIVGDAIHCNRTELGEDDDDAAMERERATVDRPHPFISDPDEPSRVPYGAEDVHHCLICGQAADRPIHRPA